MTDKATPEFQLNPKDPRFDTHNMVLNGLVQGLIKFINGLDLNNDKKKDIGQIAPFVERVLPLLFILNEVFDVEGWLLHKLQELQNSPFVKNKAQFVAVVSHIAAEVGNAKTEFKLATNPGDSANPVKGDDQESPVA